MQIMSLLRLIAVEDKNFALFNYVNELNNQIETLQEQIIDIKKDIQRFEGQGVELEAQRKEIRDQTDATRSHAITLGNDYNEKTQATKKILDQCCTGQ